VDEPATASRISSVRAEATMLATRVMT